MKIRQLTQNDAKEFWRVRLDSLKECPEAFSSSYEEEKETTLFEIENRLKRSFESKDSEFILGCFDEKEELVGIVGLYREWRQKMKHKANIYATYVVPEARTKGIGRELILESINRAKNMNGLEQINLGVVLTNKAARNLYKSCGFEIYGVEKSALKLKDRYLDEELMVLFL